MKNLLFAFMLLILNADLSAQHNLTDSLFIPKVSAKELKTIMDTTSVPMIVNFWASWCGSCIREIPWFDSILAVKRSQIKLLLVSVDFPTAYPAQLSAFIKKQGFKGKALYLNETNTHDYLPIIEKSWTGEIPASIFINNPTRYYRVYNQQLPAKRFEVEVDKLISASRQ